MPLRQIDHMNVIAHAGAVGRRVIVAEHRQLRPFPHRYLRHERHQVVGNTVGVFTNQTTRMCTDGIEVAQDGNLPVGFGALQIPQHFLNHQLAASVRIGRLQRKIFTDGNAVRVAIHRRR